jgi:inosine-uridine nucleoside N-ribohydrolase
MRPSPVRSELPSHPRARPFRPAAGPTRLALLLAVLVPGCRGAAPAPDEPEALPIPVVLDTDIGSDIDDTWALAHLLKSPELDLRMVLCGTGDPEYRCRVAARFLEVAGRADVPVALGPGGAPANEFQRPWIEGYDLVDYPGAVHRDGVDAFIRLVRRSEVPITLIAIGPVTDIAEALRRDPTIAGRIHYIGMAGSIDRGYGEGSEPVAEANVRGDVEAFRRVLRADWLSMRLTPLDTADRVALSGENYPRIRSSTAPMLAALMENYRVWADLVTWMDVDFFEERSSTLFDVVAVYMAYGDDDLEYDTLPIRITDDGFTVRDPEAGVPVAIAMRWSDLEGFHEHLTARLLDP